MRKNNNNQLQIEECKKKKILLVLQIFRTIKLQVKYFLNETKKTTTPNSSQAQHAFFRHFVQITDEQRKKK